ncbi:sugar dehydrogenase complex small subunit (plasmid) [Salipiger sp. H15]|uniref:Sugar dehydrogenase complex small subunit n=1 Tax=Alloyangia sp. H15 TaxID=3029062 RepID=A0AAU8ASY0_9RHOB
MNSRTDLPRASRRQLLFGTAAVFATLATPGALRAALSAGAEEKFLSASQLLVNHHLDPAVGARIARFASATYPDLEQMLDAIIDTAAARDAREVEQFFEDLPEGPLRDFAYWVIQTWYTGSSSFERGATLFTYEEALLYQPTLDMVAIPSFGFSAPNGWGNDLYPLTDLPRF